MVLWVVSIVEDDDDDDDGCDLVGVLNDDDDGGAWDTAGDGGDNTDDGDCDGDGRRRGDRANQVSGGIEVEVPTAIANLFHG